MTTPNPRAKDVFLDAVGITDPGDRDAFLDAACEGDAELRRRVEALLAAHDRPESLLDRAAVAPVEGGTLPHTTAAAPLEGPGTRVGPYLLLEPLGEGGMGTVFMAEQSEPVRRRVALKVIKPGMDTRQVVARFEAERQALALMDHPNIARVLDAGATPAGRPYFVMERIDGVPITGYCDAHRLAPRQRLELFIPVCQAVQHAHQKGIIHRDLKPSNVLVAEIDGKAVPKVIDFGVAKAIEPGLTGRATVTLAGALVGTPEYMSPEQAGAGPDVDTRTDVYSLGVLLYELLTGTTPIDRDSLAHAALNEVLRRVREEDPPKPSNRLSGTGDRLPSVAAVRATEPARLTKLLRGDLDWVVMKALEKDPGRRYETANGLARDVQRHLDADPVEAGPPSAWYRFRKTASRYRAALTTTFLVAVALVTGITVSLWSAVIAGRARAEAVAQRDRARRAVDEMYTEVAEKWLSQRAKLEPVQRDFLLKALAFYEDFARDRGTDPAARAAAAEAARRAADILQKLGENDPAVSAYRRAIGLQDELVGDFPRNAVYRDDLARILTNLGALLDRTGHPVEAEQSHRRAIALREALRSDFPDASAYRDGLALSLHDLGSMLRDLPGRSEESEHLLRLAVGLWEGLVTPPPGEREHRARLAYGCSTLGDLLADTGRPEESERVLRRSIDLLQALAAEFPAVPDYRKELGHSLTSLGILLGFVGRRDEAVRAYQRSVGLFEALAGESPKVPAYRHELSIARNDLATALAMSGRLEEAEETSRLALKTSEALAAEFPDDPEYRSKRVAHLRNVAIFNLELQRFPAAEEAFRQAVSVQSGLAAEFPTVPAYRKDLAGARMDLWKFLRDVRRWAEAAEFDRQTRRDGGTLTGDDAGACADLAWFLATCPDPSYRDPSRAVELARKGVALEPRAGRIWVTLGVAEYRARAWDEAIHALSQSLELTDGGSAASWLFLAMAHGQKGDRAEARDWYEKAVAWFDRNGPDDEELARFRAEADALIQPGRRDGAMPDGSDAFAP